MLDHTIDGIAARRPALGITNRLDVVDTEERRGQVVRSRLLLRASRSLHDRHIWS